MTTDSKSLFDVAMDLKATDVPNVRQAVPFFNVKDIEASLRFYVSLWVTSVVDPDGYRLEFESPTDVPEDTVYSER